MRALATPKDVPLEVYQKCINSITDDDLRIRLNEVTDDIVNAATDYKQKAEAKQLYSIPPHDCKNDDITLGNVTKKELIDTYSSHMVGKGKPARAIYDFLLLQPPFGICPFCGFGHVTTLDHYLPKAKYPQFSVLPFNLVPSCHDCNQDCKRTAIATKAEEQSLHPYFDHQNFIDDQWLYATVRETKPATIYFFVKAPKEWDDISKERVKAHFKAFKLDSRYSKQASNQLVSLRDILVQYCQLFDSNWVRNHLQIEAKSFANQHSNSWETAMYQALGASNWYCDGGFL